MKTLKIKIGIYIIDLERIIIMIAMIIALVNIGDFYGYPAKLAAVIALLFILTIIFVLGDENYKIPLIFKLLLVYLFMSMLMLNFPKSIEYFFVVVCAVLLLTYKHREETYDFLFKWLVVIGVFYSITVYWQWLSPNTFNAVLRGFVSYNVYMQALEGPIVYGDFPGFACESNRAGLSIAPAAAFSFAHLLNKNSVINKTKYLIIFLLTYGSFFIIGRRAFILFFPACVLGILIYVLFTKRNIFSKLAGVGIILLSIPVGYLVLLNKVISILSNNGKVIDLSNREAYWKLAFKMYHTNHLFGTGMRSYDVFYQDMTHRNLVFAGAHNCYIQLLGEIGIIGVVLYFGAILYVCYLSIRNVKYYVKNGDDTKNTNYMIATLMMQCLFLMLALSESVFLAPYSCVLFFVFANVTLNYSYRIC